MDFASPCNARLHSSDAAGKVHRMLDRLGELAKVFLKLGTISFGGPAAHIALMEDEIVHRRQWLSREQFLDLLGVTYLLPGPNALEMVAHVGYLRAGLLGLVVSGICFTLPAALITAALAWAYVRYGTLPAVEPFLRGIKPVVLAIIFVAATRLAKTALRGWDLAILGVIVAAAALLGADEIMTLLAASLLGAAALRWTRPQPGPHAKPPAAAGAILATGFLGPVGSGLLASISTATAFAPLWKLGLFFLKVGAVLYGSGYVLVAYLEGGLVGDYGWLTQQQLVDAVAAGQLTPGPLITTATFVGYLVGGGPGAAVATVAIILPGFCLVAIVNPWIARMRSWTWTGRFLDAVSAASVGLTVAVTLQLAMGTLLTWRDGTMAIDWLGWLLALAAGFALWRWKVSAIWLVPAGALVAGLLHFAAH